MVPSAGWAATGSIEEGDHFGIIDIVATIYRTSINMTDWFKRKSQIRRVSTVLSVTDSEVLHLHYEDLKRMEDEYMEEYNELFTNARERLIKVLNFRIKCLKEYVSNQKLSRNSSGVNLI